MNETTRPWPQADLEAVPHCPVCGSADLREMLQPARREFLTLSARK